MQEVSQVYITVSTGDLQQQHCNTGLSVLVRSRARLCVTMDYEPMKCSVWQRQSQKVKLHADTITGFERCLPWQVSAMRAVAEYAVLSESIASEVCTIATSTLNNFCREASTPDVAAPAVILAALSTGEKLLESFPGMQEAIMAPIGSLACCVGDHC